MQITENLLTPNQYSRPQTPLKKVTKIAIHYVGNPNTSALSNRNYFENCKNIKKYVSSHFVIGLQGEIIQCVPENEIAYCTNQANSYSISIETCHPKADGIFSDITYISLCELCAYLVKKYKLTVNDLIRHYDVTTKQCPLHWSPTKYQSEALATARWNRFKQDVQTVINGGTVTKNNTVSVTVGSNSTTINTNTTIPITTNSNTVSNKVKIISDTLNVRKDAGTNYDIVAVLKKNEVYTIVAEKMVGSVKWGLLKSYQKTGNGWISLNEKYIMRV